MNRASKSILIGTLIVVVGGTAFIALPPVATTRSPGRNPTPYYMQTIATELSARPLSKLSGKAFVLSVVARGMVNRKNERALSHLFSTNDEVNGTEVVDFSLYRRVTRDALRAGMDVSTLTSYAGRRNAHPEYSIRRGGKSDPLLADLHTAPWGFVIVAFADGHVERMDRKALGLDCDDPFVVGEGSKSPILRSLSDR